MHFCSVHVLRMVPWPKRKMECDAMPKQMPPIPKVSKPATTKKKVLLKPRTTKKPETRKKEMNQPMHVIKIDDTTVVKFKYVRWYTPYKWDNQNI